MQLTERVGTRRHGSRGAILVETALVMPLVLLLVFGVIEFGFMFQSRAVLSDAVRASGRVGSELPGQDDYDEAIVQVAEQELQKAANLNPKQLWIYSANRNGYPGIPGNENGGWGVPGQTNKSFGDGSALRNALMCNVHTKCIRYVWTGTEFERDTAPLIIDGWPAEGIGGHDACGATVDRLAVYISVEYKFITGLFWSKQAMADHGVFRFEPEPGC